MFILGCRLNKQPDGNHIRSEIKNSILNILFKLLFFTFSFTFYSCCWCDFVAQDDEQVPYLNPTLHFDFKI